MTASPPGRETIGDARFDGPDARLLIGELQDEYVARYGSRDDTPVDPGEFAAPDGTFLIALIDGEPAGCAGLRRYDRLSGELKRMYVRAAHRRRGLAARLLLVAEQRARELGYTRLVLETGLKQPEAMALYQKQGYRRFENFGHYRCSPSARSYSKAL